MQFRVNTAAEQQNNRALKYLADKLEDPEAGRMRVRQLIDELGNAVQYHPDWHPIITYAQGVRSGTERDTTLNSLYPGIDHTECFVRGFVTCPYGEDRAEKIVAEAEKIDGIYARRLDMPLYADTACPVIVQAFDIDLAADGTIDGPQALRFFINDIARLAQHAQVAETWWNIRDCLLGSPRGARSSLFVDQHAGGHMRKILEAMNDSGMFGPIKESSLEMLSEPKRQKISQTLIEGAVEAWKKAGKPDEKFTFRLRGETCEGVVRDTWDDGYEESIIVKINGFDLHTSGFHYPDKDIWEPGEPRGKRALAEKFA